MAEEGLRRSTRVRKPVKSYAVEQAEESELALSAPPPKLKRKHSEDDENADSETPKPAKTKMSKASKQTESDSADGNGVKAPKALSSKAKRTSTNSSWHADAAERRIAARNRNVKQLMPGDQETRLKR